MRSLIILLIPLLFFFSCSDNPSSVNTAVTPGNYKLSIVDSIQVNVLASGMSIMDVHKQTGEILAIQSSPPKLWILSPEGEIKKTWEKSGDGPDEIGQYLLSAEFYGEDIAMMGMMS